MTIDDRLRLIIHELIDNDITLDQALTAFEQKYLDAALQKARANITVAAALLGIHRNTLHNKLRLYDPRRRQRAIDSWLRDAAVHSEVAQRLERKARSARRRR